MIDLKMPLIEKLMQKVLTPTASARVFKPKKVYKPMVASTQEEIDLHNKSVKTRQVVRSEKRLNDKLTTKKGK